MARFSILTGLEDAATHLAGTWIVELGAAILSIVSLGGLIVTLLIADGDQIRVWNGITLNVFVSILATAIRLSALYVLSSAIGQSKWNVFSRRPGCLLEFEAIDLASRGPFGCAQLLCRTRSVALIGALAVILSFAFDPVAQQLVQYRNDVVFSPNNANAAIPISRTYRGGNWAPIQATQGSFAVADFGMQAAIYNGFSQSASTIAQSVPVTCPSGNCTWQAVQSLAVCSRCQDVTSLLVQTKENRSETRDYDLSNRGGFVAESTRYRLPTGLYLDNEDEYVRYNNSMLLTAYGTGNVERTVASQGVDTLIWAEAMIKAGPNTSNDSAVWPDLPVEATECALYYCVRSYDINMTNNKINETSRPMETIQRNPASWEFAYDYAAMFKPKDDDDDYSPGDPNAPFWIDQLDEPFSANTSMRETLEFINIEWSQLVRTDLELGSGFNISQSAVFSISNFMQETFQNGRSSSDGNETVGGWYRAGSPAEYDPPVIEPLFQSQNLSAIFENIATSMSNAIRTYSNGSVTQNGSLGISVVKYRVAWPWISLPIVVVVAAILELTLTMRRSKNNPLWKSSILATLSRGPCVHELLQGTSTIKHMRDAVQGQEVSLLHDVPEQKSVAMKQGSTVRTRSSQEEAYGMQRLRPARFASTQSMPPPYNDDSHISLLNTGDTSSAHRL